MTCQSLGLQVQVLDNQDGTYSLAYTLPALGQWVLHVQVDSQPIRQQGYSIATRLGPVQVEDIEATVAEGGNVCGETCTLHIQVTVLAGSPS